MFEVGWRSGDVTWLPLFQIEHLEALTAYLKSLGVETVSELPVGRNDPPSSALELFVGRMTYPLTKSSASKKDVLFGAAKGTRSRWGLVYKNKAQRVKISISPLSLSSPAVTTLSPDLPSNLDLYQDQNKTRHMVLHHLEARRGYRK